MGLKWLGDQLWMTVDPLTTFIETSAPCEAAAVAVDATLPELRKHLGLGETKVRWFLPSGNGTTAGRHSFEGDLGLQGKCHGNAPSTVWIRADLGALDAAEVLGHELLHAKHYADYIAGVAEMPDGDAGEQAALAYGHSVRQALLD